MNVLGKSHYFQFKDQCRTKPPPDCCPVEGWVIGRWYRNLSPGPSLSRPCHLVAIRCPLLAYLRVSGHSLVRKKQLNVYMLCKLY